MKAIAKLKDDARAYEQREEWEKAIQAYLQVLKLGEQGDGAELDLPLYNRVGDLYVRLGRASDAVTYYEQAADRYAEAGLFNNAIALCNKALRYDASRLELLRKLGAFSASQGFYTDARRWYLEYAEKAIKRGQLDNAFDALSDYANVSDDAEPRELLARQLRDHGRKERAVDEYKRAYSLRMAAGQHAEAERVRRELLAVDPSADLSQAPQAQRQEPHAARSRDQLPGFVDFEPTPESSSQAAVAEPERAVAEPEPLHIEHGTMRGTEAVVDDDLEDIELEQGIGSIDPKDVQALDIGVVESGIEFEPSAFELPTLDEDEAGAAEPLPTFEDYDDDLTELPLLGDDSESEQEVAALPGFDGPDVNADLPVVETEEFEPPADVSMLDVGDMDRDESGIAGGPLVFPEFNFPDTTPKREAPEDADDLIVDLPAFGDVGGEFGEYRPERAFEFINEIEPELAAAPEAADAIEEQEEVAEFDEFAEFGDFPEPERVEPERVEIEPQDEPLAQFETFTFEEPEIAAAAEPEAAAPEPEPEPEPGPEPEPEPVIEAEPVVYQAAPIAEPVAPPRAPPPASKPAVTSGYIDLAALLSEDDEEAEDDSTRFVVAEQAPTGDEEQDFADMLEQFKSKVAASIPTEDAGSHYDLGIAFKEMGLIDEAIGEFQTALRAGQDKLKVYEELGSCFVLKGQYSIAITILNRAAHTPFNDEHELLGVYYNLGRAHEELGQRAEAKAAFEKIVAIDIGFADTRQRLARL